MKMAVVFLGEWYPTLGGYVGEVGALQSVVRRLLGGSLTPLLGRP